MGTRRHILTQDCCDFLLMTAFI